MRTKKAFEKAFKTAVTNFDETKIWFEHPSRFDSESKICFVLDGKLYKHPMYKTKHSIDLWKNYYIEFLATGKFDFNAYWQIYDDKPYGGILKFPFCDNATFNVHSDDVMEYLTEYRKKRKSCGIRQVPKPID